MAVPWGHIRVQIAHVALVDAPVGEAPIVRPLVDDHRVFHVVARVADYGNDGIGAAGAQIEVILQVLGRSHQRRLREQQTVDLVVHAVGVRMVGGAHRLLRHLALVHVAWALVVVAERDRARDDRQNVEAIELLVSRVWADVFFERRDR